MGWGRVEDHVSQDAVWLNVRPPMLWADCSLLLDGCKDRVCKSTLHATDLPSVYHERSY